MQNNFGIVALAAAAAFFESGCNTVPLDNIQSLTSGVQNTTSTILKSRPLDDISCISKSELPSGNYAIVTSPNGETVLGIADANTLTCRAQPKVLDKDGNPTFTVTGGVIEYPIYFMHGDNSVESSRVCYLDTWKDRKEFYNIGTGATCGEATNDLLRNPGE